MISIDQRNTMAREISGRELSTQSVVSERFPGATSHAQMAMAHELEWAAIGQTTRPNDVMEACYQAPTHEEAEASKRDRAAARAA